jgi:anti-sigma-K factor RskA
MDLQQIDSLLMDHALGGTTPEEAAVIEALAEKDSTVRARLDEWRGLANLARRTASDAPVALPPFPAHRFSSQGGRKWRRFFTWLWFGVPMGFDADNRGGQWQRVVAWGVSMAACIAIGFAVGRPWGQQPSGPSGVVAVVNTAPAAPIVAVSMRSGEENGFWSESRLRAYAMEHAGRPAAATNPFVNEWIRNHHLGA